MDLIDKLTNYQWCVEYIDFIQKNSELFSSGGVLVQLYNSVTVDVILSNPTFEWDWRKISAGRNIYFNDILNHPTLPWSVVGMSLNPNVTIDIVKKHPEYNWDIMWLRCNPNITIDVARENMQLLEFNDEWELQMYYDHNIHELDRIGLHTDKKYLDSMNTDERWRTIADSACYRLWIIFLKDKYITWGHISQYNKIKEYDYMLTQAHFIADRERIKVSILKKWLMASRIARWYRRTAYYDITFKHARNYATNTLIKMNIV